MLMDKEANDLCEPRARFARNCDRVGFSMVGVFDIEPATLPDRRPMPNLSCSGVHSERPEYLFYLDRLLRLVGIEESKVAGMGLDQGGSL